MDKLAGEVRKQTVGAGQTNFRARVINRVLQAIALDLLCPGSGSLG